MKTYEHIPLQVESHGGSWFSWPQSFSVPRGWLYRTDSDRTYQKAGCELSVDLCCAGDWLEIVSEEQGKRIRYEIL